MPFKGFAILCSSLQSTTKRLEKCSKIAEFLRSLSGEEVGLAVSYLLGRPFPESDERVLELGGTTLWRLPPQRQTTLLSEPLTIKEVAQYFDSIAGATGSGSRAKKEALIEGLFGRASGSEAEYILRIISGEMRIGAVEGVVMEAIADASGIELETIRRSNMLLGNLGEVAKLAMSEGEVVLRGMGLRLFMPIKPMLAEMSYSLEEVLEEHGGTTALEYKFDGARIQIHKKGNEIKVYSRRLSDVTQSLPEIVAVARKEIRASDAILEGEAIALGEGGRPLPFQDLMRRFRRTQGVDEAQQRIPLRLYLFDILHRDGMDLIGMPYGERWRILLSTVPPHLLVPRIVTGSPQEARQFLASSIAAGHEGLMAKALESTYSVGVRGKSWFKIKPYETLDLAIIAAEWGYGRREGWLSNYYLAARDEATGKFVMMGKTFKGFTDEEFKSTTARLLATKVREERNTVYVKPSIVVEVAYNEIQRSRQFRAGYSLRFARIVRIREDRAPSEADTIERIARLYVGQFEKKGRLKEGAEK